MLGPFEVTGRTLAPKVPLERGSDYPFRGRGKGFGVGSESDWGPSGSLYLDPDDPLLTFVVTRVGGRGCYIVYRTKV